MPHPIVPAFILKLPDERKLFGILSCPMKTNPSDVQSRSFYRVSFLFILGRFPFTSGKRDDFAILKKMLVLSATGFAKNSALVIKRASHFREEFAVEM